MKKAEAELAEILEEEELKSSSFTENGVTHTATTTSRTMVSYDEAGLRKALGARVYDRMTFSKLDKTKLEKAITEGEVDAHTVAQHATITTGARSMRLTRKVADESEAAAP